MKPLNTRIPLIGLFLLIAILALLLTIYSANVYDAIVKDNGKNDTASLATTYIAEKLRQNGLQQPIDVNERELVIHGEDQIDTVIYYYDDHLYETSIYADKELKHGSGEPLFEIQDIHLSLSNGILHISVADDAHEVTKRIRIYDQR